MQDLRKKEEATADSPAEPSEDILLLREIRDSLKNSLGVEPSAHPKLNKATHIGSLIKIF